VLPGGQDFGAGAGGEEAVEDGTAGSLGAQARARKKMSYEECRKAGKELA